jgi:hypothetical protein
VVDANFVEAIVCHRVLQDFSDKLRVRRGPSIWFTIKAT